jgi:MFS family permease
MTTIGLVLTAYSTSLADLLLWRSITAVGYGIVYVTTQAYITVFVSTNEGTQGQAMFLASFFTGSLSGAAIGGILVDRLGFSTTFLLSAGLSATAALYVVRSLGDETGRTVARKSLLLADSRRCCGTGTSRSSRSCPPSRPRSRLPAFFTIPCPSTSKVSATASPSPGAS